MSASGHGIHVYFSIAVFALFLCVCILEHLSRAVLVRFTTMKETEENLRLIFEHYGVIEDVIVRKDTALVSFASSQSAVRRLTFSLFIYRV